jgi:ring-1,2-phenylacetyl-CoA epoxidase subunit PaaE
MSTSRVTLRLDGREQVFEMERSGRAILDVALARGIPVPLHCHVGWCLRCRCRLVRGEVRMSEQVALPSAERALGFVLVCCSRPLSDEVVLDADLPPPAQIQG